MISKCILPINLMQEKRIAFFPAAITIFLTLEVGGGGSDVIPNKLEISPSLFNHHYGFQQP